MVCILNLYFAGGEVEEIMNGLLGIGCENIRAEFDLTSRVRPKSYRKAFGGMINIHAEFSEDLIGKVRYFVRRHGHSFEEDSTKEYRIFNAHVKDD